jgi:hypothetical protein
MDFLFNTKFDKEPLTFQFTIGVEDMTSDEAFYYKRFLTENYTDDEDNHL